MRIGLRSGGEFSGPGRAQGSKWLPACAAILALFASWAPFAGYAYADGGKTKPGNGNQGVQQPSICSINFSDVHTSDYFYEGVRYLFCVGVVSGYPDGTFRPGNLTTRGQLAKMEVLAKGWPLVTPQNPSYSDVPPTHTFYGYVETAKQHNMMGGYSDGTFHPEASVTRGQLAKVVVSAEGWPLVTPPTPDFSDVPASSPFYPYVETAVAHQIISGYTDNTFRPGMPATRAQIGKIIYFASAVPLTSFEQQTVDLINQRRTAMGLDILRVNPALTLAARGHSSDIGPQGLCQHNGTDGSSPWDRATNAGYTGFASGEVVGCGYFTPLDVVNGWWASPAHYGILTATDINDIGCGWWGGGSQAGWQTCETGSSTH